MKRILLLSLPILTLGACSSFQTSTADNHAARCEELKHQIIFNGATSNNTELLQQRAELGTLNKSYKAQGCE